MSRKTAIGLRILCALAFSAFAAQGASAAGTTAFTCKKKAVEGGVGFSREHCKPADAVSTGAKFEHVAIANGTKTETTTSNEKTEAETTKALPFEIHSTLNGVKVSLKATKVHGIGTMENREEPGMAAHGLGTITFTGVTLTTPFDKNCEVKSDPGSVAEQIVTEELTTKTVEGVTPGMQFAPAAGGVIANFEIVTKAGEHLEVCPIIDTYSLVGSVIGSIDGATVNFTAAGTTAQSSLRINSAGGPKAGFTGSLTISGRTGGAGAYTPLSAT
jgi:hypothetical protein